jgi:hypothetical protein
VTGDVYTLSEAAYPFEPLLPRDLPEGRQFPFVYATSDPRTVWCFVLTTRGPMPTPEQVRELARLELDAVFRDALAHRGIK